VSESLVHVCGNEFMERAEGLVARWPADGSGVVTIPYHLDVSGYRGNLEPGRLVAAYDRAWGLWAGVIDIKPLRAASASQALVAAVFSRIDGPGRILAQSHLADGRRTQKQQWYDSGESWDAGAIIFELTALHEIGHVLGLEHDPDGKTNAVMDPIYNPDMKSPRERDVSRLLAMGYKPARVVGPVDPADPKPGDKPTATIRIYGAARVEIDGDAKVLTQTSGD
jgi:hypothetical protein